MDVSPQSGGSIKVDQNTPVTYPATLTVDSGLSVILEAVPALGYEFVGWSGDLAGDANPATLVIDCNKQVTASFSQKTYSLTMQVTGLGSVVPSVGNHSYVEGTVVNITATPDSDQQFYGWTGAVGDASSASTTVTMDSDRIIIANFSKAEPNWWLVGAIIAGGIVFGGIIWLAARRRVVHA